MENLVELKYYSIKPEAEMDMQMLQAKGILVRLVPENQGAFQSNLAAGPVKLFVASENLEEAKKIIGAD